jgi:hypothetical protein
VGRRDEDWEIAPTGIGPGSEPAASHPQLYSPADVPVSFCAAYQERMSTKHIHTASDLVRFGASVRIECADCGSARTLSGIELVKACGAGSLAAARARLKCGRCGGKAARLAVLPPV